MCYACSARQAVNIFLILLTTRKAETQKEGGTFYLILFLKSDCVVFFVPSHQLPHQC